jgi:hypothetical protein
VKTAFLLLFLIILGVPQVVGQPFTLMGGAANPFSSFNVTTGVVRPDLVDIDGDGDLDFFAGMNDGTIRFMRNTGTKYYAVFVEITGTNNPFNGVSVNYDASIRFVDIDGDGDKDAFIGDDYGVIWYYENTGTITNPVFVQRTGAANPLSFVYMDNWRSVSGFVDIDNDGDMDVFIGANNGLIKYFENTGSVTSPVFVERTGAANPLSIVNVGGWAAPSFGDFDNDGDMDVVVGSYSQYIFYFKNIGTTNSPIFQAQTGTLNPFNGIYLLYSIPTVVDLNADNDLDIVFGGFTVVNYVNNDPIVPGAPTIGTATAGNASASVSFTAPTPNGGSAITGYTVTSSPGGKTGTGTSSPITVSGLTNGTAYTFTVTATNAIGTGAASGASNSVTPVAPNASPINIGLSATAINENVSTNSIIGTLSSTDPDTGNSFTYTLVAGTGSADNASFNISGSSLRINSSPNYEVKNNYWIRVRTTDQGGLWFEKSFVITINNVIEAPTATTQAATAIANNGATLKATVNANSLSTVVTFEYGITTAYGSTATATQSPVTGTSETAVSYILNGLAQNTNYHYRVKAVNADGTTYGTNQTFTTLKTIPTITSLSTNSGIIGASVTITGTNFSTTIADNEVYVGSVKAAITVVTATTITFTIPTGAVAGKVKVVLSNGEEALSATDLVILGPPTITSAATTIAPYGQLYNYNVKATSEGDLTTTITAPTKPAWLTLNSGGSGMPTAIGSIPAGEAIYGVATDDNGNIYAKTFYGTIIYKISPDGTTTVWKSGLISGFVYELHISNGYLYVPRFSNAANSITRIPLNNPSAQEEHFASLTSGALALTSKDGWIYASDYNAREIVRINETTKVKETILTSANGIPSGGPFGLSFDNAGNLYFATHTKLSIMQYNGSELNTVLSGLPRSVTSVKVDKQGNFYVAMEEGGLRKYKPDFSTFELVSVNPTDDIWGLCLTEAGAISYTIPGVGVFNINTGAQLSGTPSKSDVGPHNVVLRATNDAGYTEQTFTINVVDNVAPVVSTFSPLTNATGIALKPTLSITFDEEVSLGTSGIFSIYNGATLVKSYDLSVPADKALFALSADKLTVSVALTEDLPVNTVLSVGIGAGFVKDIYNNNFVGFDANSNTWRFTTMNKNTQTITYPVIAAKTYGDATFTLGNATTNSGLTVTYTAEDPTVVSIVGNQATILKAGETKITATQLGDDNNFAATAVEQLLRVGKAVLKITADDKSKVYDGVSFSNYTVTYDGFVKNENTSVLVGNLTLSGSAIGAVNVNPEYAIIPGGFTALNYAITYVTGKLSITKRPITITAQTKTKVYGEADPQFSAEITAGSVFVNDMASGLMTRIPGESVDEYAINKGSYTYGSNYEETYIPASLTITKRPITITADAKSKTYGDTDPSFTAQVSAGTIVTGDFATGALTREPGESVADYSVNVGTYTYGANYEETYIPASLTITKRPITITAEAKSKTYGDTDPSFTAQVSAGTIVTGDFATGALAREVGESVADYSVNVGTYTYGANYEETYIPANLTITKRPITITADAKSKTYGDTDPSFTAQVSAGTIVTGDFATGALTREPGESATEYAINKATYTFGSNYDETYVSAKLTIGKRPLTVTAVTDTKTYDATVTSAALPLVGTLATGDAIDVAAVQMFDNKNHGTEHVLIASGLKIKNENNNDVTGNYSISYINSPATGRIDKKELTIANAVAQSKVYDGNATAQITGARLVEVVGDEIIVLGNSENGAFTQSTVGVDVAVNTSFSISGADAANYTLTQPTGLKADITAKELTVSLPTLTLSKVYDGNASAAVTVGELSGVLIKDIDNVTLWANANYNNANVGEGKTITVVYQLNGLAANNYVAPENYVFTDNNVAITAKQLTISDPVVVTNKMVDGNTSAAITAVSYLYGVENADASNVTVHAVANYDNALVGRAKTITVQYTLSGSAHTNYITPAPFVIHNAVISDYITLSPLANPTAGCEGGEMELSYTVLTGTPTSYKLTFSNAAIAAGIQNVIYTNLSTSNSNGIVTFAIPAGIKDGTYAGVLTMIGELGIESIDYPFIFNINLSSDLLVTKFDKIILIDNSSNRFTAYQWYKNNQEIAGANKQFYNDPEGLVGTYSVKVTTTDGQTLYTCEKVLNLASARKVAAYPNPLKKEQECTVQMTGFNNDDFENSELTVFNMQGIRVYHSTNVQKTNYINFKALPGVYVGQFTSADGATHSFKIIVE